MWASLILILGINEEQKVFTKRLSLKKISNLDIDGKSITRQAVNQHITRLGEWLEQYDIRLEWLEPSEPLNGKVDAIRRIKQFIREGGRGSTLSSLNWEYVNGEYSVDVRGRLIPAIDVEAFYALNDSNRDEFTHRYGMPDLEDLPIVTIRLSSHEGRGLGYIIYYPLEERTHVRMSYGANTRLPMIMKEIEMAVVRADPQVVVHHPDVFAQRMFDQLMYFAFPNIFRHFLLQTTEQQYLSEAVWLRTWDRIGSYNKAYEKIRALDCCYAERYNRAGIDNVIKKKLMGMEIKRYEFDHVYVTQKVYQIMDAIMEDIESFMEVTDFGWEPLVQLVGIGSLDEKVIRARMNDQSLDGVWSGMGSEAMLEFLNQSILPYVVFILGLNWTDLSLVWGTRSIMRKSNRYPRLLEIISIPVEYVHISRAKKRIIVDAMESKVSLQSRVIAITQALHPLTFEIRKLVQEVEGYELKRLILRAAYPDLIPFNVVSPYKVSNLSTTLILYEYWLEKGFDVRKEFHELYAMQSLKVDEIYNELVMIVIDRLGGHAFPSRNYKANLRLYVHLILLDLGLVGDRKGIDLSLELDHIKHDTVRKNSEKAGLYGVDRPNLYARDDDGLNFTKGDIDWIDDLYARQYVSDDIVTLAHMSFDGYSLFEIADKLGISLGETAVLFQEAKRFVGKELVINEKALKKLIPGLKTRWRRIYDMLSIVRLGWVIAWFIAPLVEEWENAMNISRYTRRDAMQKFINNHPKVYQLGTGWRRQEGGDKLTLMILFQITSSIFIRYQSRFLWLGKGTAFIAGWFPAAFAHMFYQMSVYFYHYRHWVYKIIIKPILDRLFEVEAFLFRLDPSSDIANESLRDLEQSLPETEDIALEE